MLPLDHPQKHIFVQGAYQFFWLCICLYALPKWFNRYHIASQPEYLDAHCLADISAVFPPEQTASAYPGTNLTSAAICGIMAHCGFPSGAEDRNSVKCPLWVAGTELPFDQGLALCGAASNGTCANSNLVGLLN